MSAVDQVFFGAHPRGPVTPAHLAQLDHVLANGDSAATNLLPTSGNQFRLATDTSRFGDELVADIEAAQHHFNFTVYGAQPGRPGGAISEKVISAAERRANDGLPVTAIIDEVGSGLLLGGTGARRQFVERMRDNRIDVIVRRLTFPGRGHLDDARRAVDHRKSFEIDGRIEWHGGMNLVDEWAPWPDLMQRVEGPAAAQAGAVLAARFADLGGTVTPERAAVLRAGLMAPTADASHATRLLLTGNRHQRELTDVFRAGLTATHERFTLTDPYLSDPRVMHDIVDVARRLGSDAELFISPKVTTGGQAQDLFTDPLRRAWGYRFAEARGAVHLLDQFSHGKGWRMDNVVGVGAHNKDRSSVRLSYENLMATNDPVAGAQFDAAMAAQRSRSLSGTEASVEGWRTLAHVRDAFRLQY